MPQERPGGWSALRGGGGGFLAAVTVVVVITYELMGPDISSIVNRVDSGPK
jgi:hypothetical protein